MAERLSLLTLKEIRPLLKGALKIPQRCQAKDELVKHILAYAPPDLLQIIEDTIQAKTDGQGLGKRKRTYEQDTRRVAAKQLEEDFPVEPRDLSKFLALPSMERVKECFRQFYEATSNAALELLVCGVCAREVNRKHDNVSVIALSNIPNCWRLIPKKSHHAHNLFDGKLLKPRGVTNGLVITVNVCGMCLADLQKDINQPPKFSLANGLWIRPIPWQLKILTFPEQLLIAHLYPRVYVFKLFPKNGGEMDPSTLQRGMRGNVTTFDFDMKGITSMLTGQLMPRSPEILASVISITFVGLGKLPKNWLKSTFRVRRQIIYDALVWLKRNNPKYYGEIEICGKQLGRLPEDDVPDEILSIVRQEKDAGLVTQESAGYTPLDNEQAQLNQRSNDLRDGDTVLDDDGEPDVIPLQASGTIDTDLTKVTADELMAWGILNMWKEGKEGAYLVRHGRRPVNDMRKPKKVSDVDVDEENFFEKAYPCLFPWGHGGIERTREVMVDFSDHVKWALQYHDARFRKHETFPFVAFGISQRRQALNSARVQMRRTNFEREAQIMAGITVEKLETARLEEERNLPTLDPAIRLMKRNVHAAAGRVKGSDDSRTQLRSQIWSTALRHGPPYLWITINPSDLHNPITQIFAGENINLNDFIATAGPTKEKRAQNIAGDPYAASKFFHFLIETILETLFQIKVSGHHVKTNEGILGQVAAYFGMVESQGRGTLHLHILIWLKHAPSFEEILELLKTEEFRERVVAYIRANLRAYLPGLESESTVKALPKDKEVGYTRPPRPDSVDYDDQLKKLELQLACAEQIHTCQIRRCLEYSKGKGYTCKQHAPFPCLESDFVTESGEWGPKRLYSYVNGWMPGILVNACCNNDVKLLTNGCDTKNITFYCTSYVTKKQKKHHNLSAILAQGFVYHLNHPKPKYFNKLCDEQGLLLFWLVHAINREQELAAVMVISYLMGWGDVYQSHTYSPIYWSSFVGYLLKLFPALRSQCKKPGRPSETAANEINGEQANLQTAEGRERISNGDSLGEPGEPGEKDTEEPEARAAEEGNEMVTLDLDSSGKIYAKSQITDYVCQGEELEDWNILDFFVDTYETEIKARDRQEEDENTDQHRKFRQRNQRIRYLSNHPRAKNYHRVRRSPNHWNLPNIVGRWFPRRDDPEIQEFYSACMLMLLKPWRKLDADLKKADQTWSAAFEEFLSQSTEKTKYTLAGIQYFHECENAAQQKRINGVQQETTLDEDELEGEGSEENRYTPEGLAELQASKIPWREEWHGRHAIELAKQARIYQPENSQWTVNGHHTKNATHEDMQRLRMWRKEIKMDVARQNIQWGNEMQIEDSSEDRGAVSRLQAIEPSEEGPQVIMQPLTSEISISAAKPDELKTDQRQAYDIILWHLDQTLAGKEPPPLRLILYGEGGTGKSKVIQTVTAAFEARGVSDMLMKAAYTGIAASLINGKTTHNIRHLTLNTKGKISNQARKKLQDFWRRPRYLIIDEYSMISKTFLAKLSYNISIGMAKGEERHEEHSFGGLNVILAGDLHQFPPVARGVTEALFYPLNAAQDSIEAQLGYRIYEEFKTVVILKEQMRITDPVWKDFLVHLRHGRVQRHHIKMLRTLIVGRPGTKDVDFSTTPWSEAPLITPRHAVRRLWNEAAVRKWCRETGQQLFICTAKDTIGGRAPTPREEYAIEEQSCSNDRGRKRKELPREIEIAIGMKVMVTDNIETDLDIVNGSRGEIVDIILHPDEPPIGTNPIVRLKNLPAYILVKLHRTRARKLTGLEENIIPVEPMPTTMQISVLLRNGTTVKRTVTRLQLPITGTYSFTDYRAQGQTIYTALSDIATPPSGSLTLFNLYVALSRCSGRDSIRLLRDFDEEIFMRPHEAALLEEDDRLEILHEATASWWEKMKTALNAQAQACHTPPATDHEDHPISFFP